SSSTSSQDDEKSTLEEVSEGGIPIDQPPPALSTPGHQETDVSLSQATTLSKSSSSPELQTLPEAFTKAAAQSASGGDLLSARIPTVQANEREASGESAWPGESVISVGPSSSSASVSVSSSSTSRMRLEFPTAQPGPLSPAGHRPRGHTISVSAPSSRRERKMDRDSYHNRGGPSNIEKSSGLSPSFVFLQLYHSPFFGNEANKPLLLPKSQLIDRAVKVLDQMPPYDTHKIGVVFVGAGQANNEVSILSNEYGSNRYAQFLTGLGKLIHLKDCDPDQIFLGGLDQYGDDGEFTYCWHDDIMQGQGSRDKK
ncbi:tuberin-like, partial [Sinocyclocheilus grahami]|uniref:tuberin-like n=1 Tax=Sinocyclocheilus grahami TaxID=75366 RepID=UPI0007ACE43D